MNEGESTVRGDSAPQSAQPLVPAGTAQSKMSEQTVAMLAHLASLSAFVGVPFGNVVGPLLVWVIKKDEMPFVDRHGKEAINFGISITIYLFVSALLIFLLIGFVLLPLVGILALVFPIIAAIRANEGKEYRYPLTIRFLT